MFSDNNPLQKRLLTQVGTTVLTVLIVFGLVGSILYLNRGAIVNYVVSQYTRAPSRNSTTTQNLLIEEQIITNIVARANPAVVSIVVSKEVPVFEELSPFDDFFGFQFPVPEQRGTEEREIGEGSGFIVSPDGLVVTNRHVVEDEEATYTLFTNDGEQHKVKVIAKDPFFDIAVLQITEPGIYPFIPFGNSDILQPGQTVIAIGNALAEFRNSVSVGVISGLSRTIVASNRFGQGELLEEVIQTDAAINPGNSGGPLLNTAGEVVGVNVAVAQGSENISFALPSNLVASVVESVREYGEIVRPYLGVRYVQITETIAEQNNLPVDYGVLIIRGETPEELAVISGSPADKAGIVENDIILEVDGVRLTLERSLASLIRTKEVGDQITLTILHDGEEQEVSVVLEKAPDSF